MVLLQASSSWLVIAFLDGVHLFRRSDGKQFTLKLPSVSSQLKQKPHDKKHVKRSQQTNAICAEFSNDYSLFALSDCSKRLLIWRTDAYDADQWILTHEFVTQKRCKVLRFVESNKAILVGDKSCDVYRYSLQNSTEMPNLLLGHVSMLLDMRLNENEQLIITCDRDESIRVSAYPKSYVIHSFCLGHREFVSCSIFLGKDKLISGSGDGTVRLWDCMTGEQLNCFVLAPILFEKLAQRDVEQFDVEKDEQHIAVQSLHLLAGNLLLVTLHELSTLILLSIEQNQLILVSTINIQSSVLAVTQTNDENEIWILRKEQGLTKCIIKDGNQIQLDDTNILTQSVNEMTELSQHLKELNVPQSYNWLYKSSFDNLETYFETKRKRQENNNKKQKC